MNLDSLAFKLVAGVVLVAVLVSGYFYIQHLQSELAIAAHNLRVEEDAHKATKDQLALVRQQNQLNEAISQHQLDLREANTKTAGEIKGVTENAKPEGNAMPPVLLDVLDRLRVSGKGAGPNAIPP